MKKLIRFLMKFLTKRLNKIQLTPSAHSHHSQLKEEEEEVKEQIVYKESYIDEWFILKTIQEIEDDGEESKRKKKITNKKKILTLKLQNQKSKRDFTLILTEFWAHTRLILESEVQIIGTFHEENNFTLTLKSCRLTSSSTAEFLIVEPKILISWTYLTENYCKSLKKWERTVRINRSAYKNPAIYGKMIHLIFGSLLGTKATERAIFDKIVHSAIEKYWTELYQLIEEDENDIIQTWNDVIRKALEWKTIFEYKYAKYNKYKLKLINQVAEEQECYSLRYGLKGKIDSVCEFEDFKGNKSIYGVELKTGIHKKVSYQHQVSLYSLLLREAYTNASHNNMLVYLHDASNSQLVYWSHKSLSKLLQYRNKLINNIIRPRLPKSVLVPMVNLPLKTFRRTTTISEGYIFHKWSPIFDGFRLTLSKDITKKLKEEGHKFKTPVQPKQIITVRTRGSNLVFSLGKVDKIMYEIHNLESDVTKKQIMKYKLPELDEEDTWFMRIVIKYADHPYVNSRLIKSYQGE